MPPPELAGLLLAGLYSDTLILRSPTTTDRDHHASSRLSRWAFVGGGPLEGETPQSFGERLLEAGTGLGTLEPQELLRYDLKLYEANGVRFAISQTEVTKIVEVEEHFPSLYRALEELQEEKRLDFAMLMITDIVNRSSYLILTDAPPELEELPYPVITSHVIQAEGVVSRKLQLLPVVLSLLES